MGYCLFFQFGSRYNRLYRDTGSQGHSARGHDTASSPATQPHDTVDLRAGRVAAHARMAWPLECVTIQNFVSWRRGSPCVATRAATRRPAPCDTTQEHCDTRNTVRSAHGRGLGRDTIFIS